MGTSISLQSGGTAFNMLGDLHKNCAGEIILVLRARLALVVDLVRLLSCWLLTE